MVLVQTAREEKGFVDSLCPLLLCHSKYRSSMSLDSSDPREGAAMEKAAFSGQRTEQMDWNFVTVDCVRVPPSRSCTAILNDHVTSGDLYFLIYRKQYAFTERWQQLQTPPGKGLGNNKQTFSIDQKYTKSLCAQVCWQQSKHRAGVGCRVVSVDARSLFGGQGLKLTWIVPRRDKRSVPCA